MTIATEEYYTVTFFTKQRQNDRSETPPLAHLLIRSRLFLIALRRGSLSWT